MKGSNSEKHARRRIHREAAVFGTKHASFVADLLLEDTRCLSTF